MSKTIEGNEMSDLIERVARAMAGDDDIVGHKDGPLGWMYYRKPARAAIAAVAEWMTQDGEFNAEYIALKLLKQLGQPK